MSSAAHLTPAWRPVFLHSVMFRNERTVRLEGDRVIDTRTGKHVKRTDGGEGFDEVVKLKFLRELAGEVIDLSVQGEPPAACTFVNGVVGQDGKGKIVAIHSIGDSSRATASDRASQQLRHFMAAENGTNTKKAEQKRYQHLVDLKNRGDPQLEATFYNEKDSKGFGVGQLLRIKDLACLPGEEIDLRKQGEVLSGEAVHGRVTNYVKMEKLRVLTLNWLDRILDAFFSDDSGGMRMAEEGAFLLLYELLTRCFQLDLPKGIKVEQEELATLFASFLTDKVPSADPRRVEGNQDEVLQAWRAALMPHLFGVLACNNKLCAAGTSPRLDAAKYDSMGLATETQVDAKSRMDQFKSKDARVTSANAVSIKKWCGTDGYSTLRRPLVRQGDKVQLRGKLIVHLSTATEIVRTDGGEVMGQGEVHGQTETVIGAGKEKYKVGCTMDLTKSASPPMVANFQNPPRSSDPQPALLELFEGMLEWLKEHAADGTLAWPQVKPPTSSADVKHQVSSSKGDEHGFFARRPAGMTLTDMSCKERPLQAPDFNRLLSILVEIDQQDLARGLDVDSRAIPVQSGHEKEVKRKPPHEKEVARKPLSMLKPDDLPLNMSTKPLEESFGRFTQVITEKSDNRRDNFGYDLEQHARVRKHLIAKGVLERYRKDIPKFYNLKDGSKNRLCVIDTQLDAAMEQLERSANSAQLSMAHCDEALGLVKRAQTGLAELQSALRDALNNGLNKVSNALQVLLSIANHTWRRENDSEDKKTERHLFELAKMGEQESEIDFAFMVKSLLSSNAQAEWKSVNPFIEQDVQEQLMLLVTTMLLHATLISQLKLLTLDCGKLARLMPVLSSEITQLRDTPAANSKVQIRSMMVTFKGIGKLADSIADQLQMERHSINPKRGVYDPRLVVFEFLRSIVLRKGQVDVSLNFLAALKDENLAKVDKGGEDAKDAIPLAMQMLMVSPSPP